MASFVSLPLHCVFFLLWSSGSYCIELGMFIDLGPFLSVCCFETVPFAVVVTSVVFPSVASVKSAVLFPCAEPSSHQLSLDNGFGSVPL